MHTASEIGWYLINHPYVQNRPDWYMGWEQGLWFCPKYSIATSVPNGKSGSLGATMGTQMVNPIVATSNVYWLDILRCYFTVHVVSVSNAARQAGAQQPRVKENGAVAYATFTRAQGAPCSFNYLHSPIWIIERAIRLLTGLA